MISEQQKEKRERTRIGLDDDLGRTTVVQLHGLDDIARGLLVRDEPPVAPSLDVEKRLPVRVARGWVHGELARHPRDALLRGERRRLGFHDRRRAI